MEMPLSPGLLQKAGITTGASQYANKLLSSGSSGVNLGTPTSMQPSKTALNVNGNLSLILQGVVSNYLNIVLRQNNDSVLGHGNMISGNSFQNVTANGMIENRKLSLTIDPDGGSDIYKLELQSDGLRSPA